MEDLFGNPLPVEPGKLEIKESQLAQIKALFLAGKKLTVQSVLKLVHTQELRTYVPILRRDHGMQIDSQWVHHGSKKFKVYYLKSA
jgi:hypothetical protein